MTNQDWTPPEVVFVERDVVKALASPLSAGAAKGFVHTYDNVLFNGHSYTLTSSVEKVKQKAVREVLEKIAQKFEMRNLFSDADIALLIAREIASLRTQYQDPQPTEVRGG